MKNFLSKAAAIAMLLLPGFAFAAFNDVLLGPTNTILSVNGATVTVASATTTLESIVVGSASFDVTFAAGSNITITAPSLSVTAMSVTQSLTTSCASGVTTLTITAAVAGTATIMPSTTACGTAAAASGGNGPIASSGGGGGGGGGGGLIHTTPVAAPTPVPAAPPRAPQVSLFLDFGMGAENSDVIVLQTFLENKGFLKMPPGLTKGHFGALTKQALIAYQKSVGISGTGYVGPKTRAAINGAQSSALTVSVPVPAGGAFTRDLEVGVVGDDVKQLQAFLNTHGFIVSSSGAGSVGNETTRFGAATKKALAKFQAANGITPASGYFGLKTRAAVNAMK